MLTQLTIRNFKALEAVDIDLGDRVVFVGPNNAGKTTALQALALWETGLRRWIEKRGTGAAALKKSGVAVNRHDLAAVPVPDANLLWRNLQVRGASAKGTRNIRIDIVVRGVTDGRAWACGLEFDYANEESFYCRPLRLSEDENPERMPVPPEAAGVRVAFLPPMAGLSATEMRIDPGAIQARLGEGRTSEVLRNLCHQIAAGPDGRTRWAELAAHVRRQFGLTLEEPRYLAERGEITLSYVDAGGVRLDIASSGRGVQQTLLLLAHMAANPGAVLLLDEPDAHLEILRQRQVYQLLADAAQASGSQFIATSHSEVILNEAADRDVVVAFVGRPHRIDDRGSQVLKSLREIGFEQYYQAEATGWVLYLKGAADLATLRIFAQTLNHPVQGCLERPFVHYVENNPRRAQEHFQALRAAKPDLAGFALYDRLDAPPPPGHGLEQMTWRRRELANYLARRDVILDWVEQKSGAAVGPLFATNWREAMVETIERIAGARLELGDDPWGPDIKASDQFLTPLFRRFFERLGLPDLMDRTDYHDLARFVPADRMDPEIAAVLDRIVAVARPA